ncbi:ankyrin repeat domain-containing protein [Noviherbaspirillum pedocola]|uniref:Ankyrin repeat domain-containing protein n=1 Tax=Noviherbaspirillum pedocola TaxID=2801341 RepID=A0A934T472_9BURK|nr:ankyrin repeat domain-containing protein [Noviherbaspirillum pedocola]MBK4738848.1 ankyrin repeat domain-containing protein [Noviherbaspirillum pedocola]
MQSPPVLNAGQKRTTPESGFDARADEHLKCGRSMTFATASSTQHHPLPQAGTVSASPHTGLHPGANFINAANSSAHALQAMGSPSMSPARWPEVTPQIFECENREFVLNTSLLPRGTRESLEGKYAHARPPLYAALLSRNAVTVRQVLAHPFIDVNSADAYGCTALHYAAATGMSKAVEMLVHIGCDPNIRDNDGLSALHYAALNGLAATAAVLLAAPDIDADLEIRGKAGHTALMLATHQGETRIVELLLNRQAINVNVRNTDGNTPLLLALDGMSSNSSTTGGRHKAYEAIAHALLARNDIDIHAHAASGNNALMRAVTEEAETLVQRLLGMPGVDVNARNAKGHTALMTATQCSNAGILRALLAMDGIDVNARDQDGNAALMYAARSGSKEAICTMLDAAGVNIDARNSNGDTAFGIALKRGQVHVAAQMFARMETNITAAGGSSSAALTLAAAKGDVDAVRALLGRPDIDVNFSNESELTALMLAAANGHEAVTSVLLEAKDINVNHGGPFGSSALMLAAGNGHAGIVASLLARDGIDINAVDHSENTALMHAADHGHAEVVKLLLASPGIDVNVISDFGGSAIEYATIRGQLEVLKQLIVAPTLRAHGDIPNALEQAVWHGQGSAAQLLLCLSGFGVNAAYRLPSSILVLAARLGHEQIVRLLLAMPDIDVNAQNEEGHTALISAAQKGHAAIVRALLSMPDILPGITNMGSTALDFARINKHEAVIHALEAHVLPPYTASSRLQKTLGKVFASATRIATLSAADAARLDGICEGLESGKHDVAGITALFASIAPLGDDATKAFARSLAFGFCTGQYRNATGRPDEAQAILGNAPRLREYYDATVAVVSAAGNIDLHRIDRSNLLGIAAWEGNVRMIRGLIRMGANVNLPSPNGRTALAVAVKRRNWTVCAELVSHGALPTLPITNGRMALHHIVDAFGADDASEAVAHLIRDLRIGGMAFDFPMQNPDPAMREARPVVMLNALLAGKVEAWSKFGHIVHGLEGAAAAAGTAPMSTADASSILSDTSRNAGSASRGKPD